jgi:type I restriction enzyme R subunit
MGVPIVSGDAFAESTVEDAALVGLGSSGFTVTHGPDIAFGQPGAERSDPTYRDVVLEWRLREALVRLNPHLPQEALDDAFRKIVRAEGPSLIERNRAVHRMLVDGVTVEYRRADGSIAAAQARVIDFEDPGNNDWLAVNQFTVVGPQGQARRADIVMFVNGLPLGVIELKNPAEERADICSAFRQLESCWEQIAMTRGTREPIAVDHTGVGFAPGSSPGAMRIHRIVATRPR